MVNQQRLGFSPGLSCALALLVFAACRPDTEGGASLIEGPRVLAIRSVPAEVEPGKPVAYTALYATPTDEPTESLEWALCTARKPLAVAGPIALECLQPSGSGLKQLGKGDSATTTMPADGCRVFGPSPPAPKMGEPAARPADPDSTGGYFQPLRVRAPGSESEYAIGFTRVACGAGSAATQDQTLEFAKNYRPNENPLLDSVLAEPEGAATPLAESPEEATRLAAGQRVTFRAGWADCPLVAACGDGICGAAEDKASCAADCATARGCTGSEPYVYLDPIARELVPRREAMRVSWFASAGTFAHDRSGRAEAEADSAFSDNDWTAPKEAGDVRVWVVLRDDRGGVGYRSFYVHVE